MCDLKSNLRMGECLSLNNVKDVCKFCFSGFHELESRRCVIKKVFYFNRRSFRAAYFFHMFYNSALNHNPDTDERLFYFRCKPKSRYARNAWERFSTKAECFYGKEFPGISDLARGMTLKRQKCVIPCHPLAIIRNAYELLSADF